MTASVLPDPETEFGARVQRRLKDEQVIWITTIDQHGVPQPNPVGFVLQDDQSILIYSMARAARLKNIAERRQVTLHFDSDGTGGDIVVFTGAAQLAEGAALPHENPAYMDKYGESLLRVSKSPEEFSQRFSVAVRIDISRTRGR